MPSTPPVIRQLSEAVANQIAAGEVIERPSAVVKELAENALDAGATRIVVRIEDGGRRLVELEDDGHGMQAADLPLALNRHATSKLSSVDDLFRIATLGFRGEALPSIAAVSDFQIASRPHAAASGMRLSHTQDLLGVSEPCAMAPGTRVSVRNLFWNVPVRLKFLKSEAAETGHITDQVMRLALSHPRVAFRLENIGQDSTHPILDLPGDETLGTRVRTLFGRQLADRLLAVAHGHAALQVSGFVAHPQEARATAKRQYLFLNGRFVKDRLLLAAVREGFKGFLEPRLHGSVFLHLDLDPALVDVNVHPTKSEVRFRHEGEVFTAVRTAIQQALGEHAGGFSLLGTSGAGASPPAAAAAHAPLPMHLVRQVVKPAGPASTSYQERYLPRTPITDQPAAESRPNQVAQAQSLSVVGPRIASLPSSSPNAHAADAASAPHAPPAVSGHTAPPAMPGPGVHLPGVRRVLQLNRMYLLIETDQGIRLVDQHALHEKALFLCLDPAAEALNSGGRQELLLPRTVELLASEVSVLEGVLGELRTYGIEAEVFGPTTVLVRAYPAALRRVNWASFFGMLADSGSPAQAFASLKERIAHSAACHGAIKAGQILSGEEQMELVRLLYVLENMEHCPHGRPTTLDLSWGELERRFQR